MDKHRTRFLASLSARLDQDRALRESEVEAPPTWSRHSDQTDAAREPSPTETPAATAPVEDVPEPHDRPIPSASVVPPDPSGRRGLTVEALRIVKPDQSRVAAAPWSETGMSQALRDAIASVRRVSRHEMGEMPRSRGDQAVYDEARFDEDFRDPWLGDQAPREESSFEQPAVDGSTSFDRAWVPDQSTFDDDAPHEELPFDDAPGVLPEPARERAWQEEPSAEIQADDARVPSGDATEDVGPPVDDGEIRYMPEEPRDRPPLWREAAPRRSLHFAAFAAASVFVLVAGFGLGILSGAQELDRLAGSLGWPLADETVAATQGDSAPPPAGGTEPAAPAQLSDLATVRVAPLPAIPTTGQPQNWATNGMPLPPPSKPTSVSSIPTGAPATADRNESAVDDTAAALLEDAGAGGPFEPILKAPASGPRVYVHYTESAPGGPATALHLVRRLRAAGFTVEPRGVDFPIPKNSVRYFFDTDRAEAEAVSASLDGQLADGAELPVLDFTQHEPKPREGHLEVWLGR